MSSRATVSATGLPLFASGFSLSYLHIDTCEKSYSPRSRRSAVQRGGINQALQAQARHCSDWRRTAHETTDSASRLRHTRARLRRSRQHGECYGNFQCLGNIPPRRHPRDYRFAANRFREQSVRQFHACELVWRIFDTVPGSHSLRSV